MKRIISIFATGLAVLMVSCQKENNILNGPLNQITDLYTVPAGATALSELTDAQATWSVDRRYFDLTFGDALSTTLVGYDALLTPGQYILGGDEIGKAILAKTKLNGETPTEGFITVNNGVDGYAITAQIDGKVFAWKGALPFEPDPDPVSLTQVLGTSKSAGLVTAKIGTEGLSAELVWGQTVVSGVGQYLALDLYSADGYLHDGVYKACAEGGVVNAGEFGIGWDNEEWGDWGKNLGTCFFTLAAEAEATAKKITGGIVTVTSEEVGDDVIWTIFWGEEYPKEVVFEGAIPALTKPKPVGPVAPTHLYTEGDLQDCIDNTWQVAAGVKKHPITITDAEQNIVAYLELVLAEGETDLEGEYVSTEYAHEPGTFANGYYQDWTQYGGGINEGGSYYIDAEGVKQYIAVGETVIVTKIATGAYAFTGTGFSYPAAGPDYVPGEGGDDDDVTGDVVLKLTSGLTYTMEDITAANTDADKNPLSGMTLWRVTVSDAAGVVAAFDLGTSEGSEDLAGSYTVMGYPNAVGKAGNGWGFAAFGMFGGCYFKVEGAYYFLPADAGTIAVSSNSDGTLKIKFEGSIQKDDYSDGGKGGLLLNNIAKANS